MEADVERLAICVRAWRRARIRYGALLLPEGVSILSSAQSDSVIVTLGKPEVDFMVAFHCLDGPKHWLMKYICKADDDFQGGVIKTVQGDNLKFLGFVTCDVSKTEVRATGGWVKLGVQ